MRALLASRIGDILCELKIFIKVNDSYKLILAMFMYGCGQGILRPMNAIYLKDQIHLSKLEITIIMSVSLLIDIFITLYLGNLSDRLKNKRTLPIISSFLCITGLLLYMEADHFVIALISYVLATSPSSIIMGQLFALGRNHFTIEARQITEMAMVWLRTIFSLGFFFGLLLGAEAFTVVSFRGVIFGNIITYILLFGLLVIYPERRSEYKPEQGNVTPYQILPLLGLLLLLSGDAIRGLYFPLIVDSIYHSPALVSYLWSLQAIFELLWMTVVGYAANRFGALPIIRIGAISGAAVYLLYAINPSLTMLFLLQPVHSFYVSILYTVAMGYVQRMFLHRTGFGSSMYVFLRQTASFVGYTIPNFISGFSPKIFFVPTAFSALALLLLWWHSNHLSIHNLNEKECS